MSDITITCPDCHEARSVGYRMACHITHGRSTGRCRRCARIADYPARKLSSVCTPRILPGHVEGRWTLVERPAETDGHAVWQHDCGAHRLGPMRRTIAAQMPCHECKRRDNAKD